MVVLEGMMYGLAVAASCIGGPAEILDHGRTGLLFPPGDASALAQSILDLVRDQAYRIRLVAAAFKELQQHWLWPCIVDKMRAVYAELSA